MKIKLGLMFEENMGLSSTLGVAGLLKKFNTKTRSYIKTKDGR